MGGLVTGLWGRGGLRASRNVIGSRLTCSGPDVLTVLTGSGLTRLAVLSLRSGDTGLTVLVLLGGIAVLAILAVLTGLTVGAVDRWLAHEHFPHRFLDVREYDKTPSGYRDAPDAAPAELPIVSWPPSVAICHR